jgi:hypothetical protein
MSPKESLETNCGGVVPLIAHQYFGNGPYTMHSSRAAVAQVNRSPA